MSVPKTFIRLMKVQQADDQQAHDVAVGGGRSTDEVPKAAAEVTEGRSEPKGNAHQPTKAATPSAGYSSSGLMRVRQAAENNGQERFTALLHHVTESLLTDAYQELNPKASVGVDHVTWATYGEQLRDHITGLHTRVHTGRYKAQPSRRVWIPKPDGRQRPLGVAALEDKIVQLAVTWVLNAIYETALCVNSAGFSYGFRPGRSQRHALNALWVALTDRPINWCKGRSRMREIRQYGSVPGHTQLLNDCQCDLRRQPSPVPQSQKAP